MQREETHLNVERKIRLCLHEPSRQTGWVYGLELSVAFS